MSYGILDESISKTIFPVKQFSQYVDIDRLRWYFITVFDNKLALATDSILLISEGIQDNDQWSDEAVIQTAIQFDSTTGKATAITWVNSEILAVGFESGIFSCFHIDGTTLLEYRAFESPILSFQISSREIQDLGQPNIWILFENGVIAVVSYYNIRFNVPIHMYAYVNGFIYLFFVF